MGAIKKYTNNVSEAVLAVQAGNDILLTRDYHKHLAAVKEAYKSGDIKEEIINKACKRIIAWKLKYILFREPEKEDEESDYVVFKKSIIKGKKKNTALIITLSVLGVILVGTLIFFLIKYIKNKNKRSDVDTSGVIKESE